MGGFVHLQSRAAGGFVGSDHAGRPHTKAVEDRGAYVHTLGGDFRRAVALGDRWRSESGRRLRGRWGRAGADHHRDLRGSPASRSHSRSGHLSCGGFAALGAGSTGWEAGRYWVPAGPARTGFHQSSPPALAPAKGDKQRGAGQEGEIDRDKYSRALCSPTNGGPPIHIAQPIDRMPSQQSPRSPLWRT